MHERRDRKNEGLIEENRDGVISASEGKMDLE